MTGSNGVLIAGERPWAEPIGPRDYERDQHIPRFPGSLSPPEFLPTRNLVVVAAR
jgi:hypothetical protein